MVRPQGKMVLYGVPDRDIANFPAKDIVLRDLTLYGALPDRREYVRVGCGRAIRPPGMAEARPAGRYGADRRRLSIAD